MSLKDEIKRFIEEELVDEDDPMEIGHDTHLVDSGILDSMGVLQIVTFLEEEAGVRVSDADVTLEAFESVSSIADLVLRLRDKPRSLGAADD